MEAVRPSSPADMSELNSARSLAVLSVPPRSKVLCVNRGDPETGRLLAQRGCQVAAVEVERQSSSFVPPQCALVIAGDVETANTRLCVADESFDAILLLDVLGYLRDPSAALAWASERLRPEGRLIASFGNIAHGAVRLSLLRGRFPYTDIGLLDRARVRFYDQRSAEALLLDAGLRIDERLRVTRGFEETEIPTNTLAWPPDVVAGLLLDREATTYEFVFVASQGLPGVPAADASLAERLQRRVEELESECRATEARATRMRTEVDACTSAARALEEQASHDRQRAQELEDELTRRMDELRLRQHDLRQLQADIADREAFIAQFRAQASADRATMDALGAELQHARALLEAGRTEAEQSHAEAGELSARIVEMSREDDQRAASMRQLSTELDDARTAHATLSGRLASEQAQLVTARSELERACADMCQLSTELDDARTAQATLSGRLASEHAQLVTARSELERACAGMRLSTELDDARTAQATLSGRLASEHAQLVTARSELERACTELSAVRAYANSAGFRIVNQVSLSLRRHTRVYAALRSIVRKIAPRSPAP